MAVKMMYGTTSQSRSSASIITSWQGTRACPAGTGQEGSDTSITQDDADGHLHLVGLRDVPGSGTDRRRVGVCKVGPESTAVVRMLSVRKTRSVFVAGRYETRSDLRRPYWS